MCRFKSCLKKFIFFTFLFLLTTNLYAQAYECLVVPRQTIDISSQVEGIIETITVDRGDLVTAGQLLITLKSEVEKISVEMAKELVSQKSNINYNENRYKFLKRKYNRSISLLEKEFISDADVDELKTEMILADFSHKEAIEKYRIIELEYLKAKKILDMRQIRSPVSGVIVERYVSIGEYINEKPIIRIAQIDPLDIKTVLPALIFGKIKSGAQLSISPEFASNKKYVARVVSIDKVIEAASGMFSIRLELINPDEDITAGMKCSIEVH